MSKKHQDTLQAVFADPVRSNIAWRDIEAMLEATGAEVTEGEGPRVRIALNGLRAVFHRPHPQERNRQGIRPLDAPISNRGRSNTMMEYKGYIGKVEFDDEAGIFHGEVINTRDVVTFQGQSVAELEEGIQRVPGGLFLVLCISGRGPRKALLRPIHDAHLRRSFTGKSTWPPAFRARA